MKGFTYPGVSPLKGKQKVADLAAADARGDSATEDWKEAMSEKAEGTDLMKGNNPKYGEVPFQKRAPLKESALSIPMRPAQPLPVNQPSLTPSTAGVMPPPKESFGSKVKGAMASSMGQALGQAAGEAVVSGAVNLAFGALSNKKEKPTRKGGSAAGFSRTKIGRS